MHTSNKRSSVRRGNIHIVMIVVMIVPILVASIAQTVLAVKTEQLRTIDKISSRYEILSFVEAASAQVLSEIENKYLDEIIIENIESNVEEKLVALFNKTVDVVIVDELEVGNQIQIKILDNEREYILSIVNIVLDEQMDPLDESVKRYLINLENCSIERGVRYV